MNINIGISVFPGLPNNFGPIVIPKNNNVIPTVKSFEVLSNVALKIILFSFLFIKLHFFKFSVQLTANVQPLQTVSNFGTDYYLLKLKFLAVG